MGATLPGGVKLAGLPHHLIDLGDMLLLERDLFPGVFFKPHALVHYQREQLVVLAKCSALVIQRFTQNLGDVMFVGLDQFADVEGRMPSVAWLRIQLMIGMRAWPKTIRE
jgi:hypothetical protein